MRYSRGQSVAQLVLGKSCWELTVPRLEARDACSRSDESCDASSAEDIHTTMACQFDGKRSGCELHVGTRRGFV